MKIGFSNGWQPLRNDTSTVKDDACEVFGNRYEITSRRSCGADETASPDLCKSLTLSRMLKWLFLERKPTEGGLSYPFLYFLVIVTRITNYINI